MGGITSTSRRGITRVSNEEPSIAMQGQAEAGCQFERSRLESVFLYA